MTAFFHEHVALTALNTFGIVAHARRLALCTSLCPTWVQTCMVGWDGEPPSDAMLDAYLARLEQAGTTALRGVHRYAADAFVVVMGMHILREWLLGRYRHWRRAIWWTGVPLVGLAFVSAVGGFWLNWDRLGQYSVVATADWLDALPILGASGIPGVWLNAAHGGYGWGLGMGCAHHLRQLVLCLD